MLVPMRVTPWLLLACLLNQVPVHGAGHQAERGIEGRVGIVQSSKGIHVRMQRFAHEGVFIRSFGSVGSLPGGQQRKRQAKAGREAGHRLSLRPAAGGPYRARRSGRMSAGRYPRTPPLKPGNQLR